MSTATEEIERLIVNELNITDIAVPDKPKNNCTGALIAGDQFSDFKHNFQERIIRLAKKLDNTDRRELGKKLKDLAVKPNPKWAGPYSEIIVLDALLSEKDIIDYKYVSVKKGESISGSLASINNAHVIDNDISLKYQRFRINLDVKSLVPDSFEILENIAKEVEESSSHRVLIGLTEHEDLSVMDIQSILADNRRLIKTELEQSIKCQNPSISININDKTIKFKIIYLDKGQKTLLTEGAFNPYKKAEVDSYKPIYHFGKLMPTDYNFLIYVTNPWWNRQHLSEFEGVSREYYRSFARRLFVGFNNSVKPISEIGAGPSSISIGEVSNQIAGIMFIEDYSINRRDVIYGCYLYLNPNYKNEKPLRDYDFCHLFQMSDIAELKDLDDFFFDNY